MGLLSGGPLSPGGFLSAISGDLSLTVDPDVATFFAAMDSAGEAYWLSEKVMLNNLATKLKQDSVWNLFTMLWFPVGESLTGAMRALKHPLGVGFKMTNNGFTQDKWNRKIGIDQRSVDAHIETGTFVNQHYSNSNNFSMAVQSESSTNRLGIDIGSSDKNAPLLFTSLNGGTRTIYRTNGSGSAIDDGTIIGERIGLFIASTIGANAYLSKNGQIYATRNDVPIYPPISSTAQIELFRGRYTDYAAKIISAGFLGKGLTINQHSQIRDAFDTA